MHPHPQNILEIKMQSSQEIFYVSAREALVGVVKNDANRYQKSRNPKVFVNTSTVFKTGYIDG